MKRDELLRTYGILPQPTPPASGPIRSRLTTGNIVGQWIAFIMFFMWMDSRTQAGQPVSLGILNLFWLIIPAFLVILWIWAKLTYRYYLYELTEDGFRKEHGVIWKKYVTIPYERVQNVDIYRGVIARLLGLSDLHIQTAGASAQYSRYGALGLSAEGRLMGLSREDAEKIRDELIKRAKGSKGQGL